MVAAERRIHSRQKAFYAVEIDAVTRKRRIGVTRDASERGLLIASPSRFEVGEALQLRVLVPNEGTRAVGAKVTRVEENGKSSPEMWRYRFAVQLDESC
jgi:hypothetical protein